MHKTWAAPVAHEDVFVEHYAWLREWARTLAKGDRSLADDLLHTAYVQFTTRRPDLGAVRDLEAYLYTLLRNLHLSHARWASRHEASLTVVDYDSVTLAVHNAGAGIEVWDQLRAVCAYACRRKETSKAGSVLLLRFFHGYFPSEIGKILRSPPKTVNEWLRLARCEARTYLENPGALAFAGDPRTAMRREAPHAGGADGFADLRREIFAARAGVCLDPADLRRLYQPATDGSVPCSTLAHIVSCASCLDAVTRLLALHGYDERDPTDTLGNNSSSIGGRSVPSRPSGPTPLELRAWETGRLTVLEHQPKELQIGVNGFRLSAVRVRSAVTDLGLTVPLSEPIDFIEIRSEQSVRLLIFEVDPPPRGAVEQTATVTLSNGRRLDATLSFADSWPALHIAYHDPQWTAQPAPELDSPTLHTLTPVAGQEQARHAWVAPRIWDLHVPRRARWRDLRTSVGRGLGRVAALSGLTWIGRLALAHRQAAVSTALALLALVWWAPSPWREAPLSAAELLDRTRTLERQVLSPADLVVRRVIELEERRPPEARAVARRRIEVWRNAGKRLAIKRAYDEAGRLIAGEWTRADGSRTLYRTGAAPEMRADGDAPRLTPEDVWRLEPLAADFERLVGTAAQAGVEERGNSYVVHYRSREQGRELLEATLTIDKDSQHAVAQTLLVRHDGALREYRFSEADVDRLPEGDVRPEAFEPEPVLLGPAPPPLAGLITVPRRPARARVRAPAPTGALLDPLEMAVWHV
ncbi:MAG: hypothetical protein ACRD26_03970, partial [Vicinamibacterales bacterium]